jgi:hypothetical protein
MSKKKSINSKNKNKNKNTIALNAAEMKKIQGGMTVITPDGTKVSLTSGEAIDIGKASGKI